MTADPEVYAAVAAEARHHAAQLDKLAHSLAKLAGEARSVLGGTATGADHAMMELAGNAAARVRRAVADLHTAADAATRASREATEAQRREREQQAARGGGR